SVVLCPADFILRPRKMIKPDIPIPGIGQFLDGAGKDAELLKPFGEESRETSLLFLHPRHVSVAEHRDAVGVHNDDLIDGVGKALSRLMWQSVDQIDVDAFEAKLASVVEQPLGDFIRLNPMNCLLNARIEVLDPQTQ